MFFEPGTLPDDAKIHDPSHLRQNDLHSLWRHWRDLQETEDGMGLRFVACEKKDSRKEPSQRRKRSRPHVKYVDPESDEDEDEDNDEDEEEDEGKVQGKGKGKEREARAASEQSVVDAILGSDGVGEDDGADGDEGAPLPHVASPAAVPQTKEAQLAFLRQLSQEPSYLDRVTFISENLVLFSFL
jgi:hypothetical protein